MRAIPAPTVVMTGLVPVIHGFACREKNVDARDTPAHDGERGKGFR